jgi:formylglycine-generating enzyme required for sulfatase activity
MVQVPAGEFLMGSTDQQIADAISAGASADWVKGETPQHTLTLPAYEIGKTEVTNAQFRPFVTGDGYTNQRYWDDAGWQWRIENKRVQPACWDNADFNGDQQPVVCVTLYEAAAYARWLSAQTGQNFTLPTEAQWEKAARGSDGRIYPWGDTWDANRANIDETGLGKTTPVGQYPNGASPYGALDMVGNVWEWTQSELQAYPLVQPTEETLYTIKADRTYVLRGGAWNDTRVNARCAYRGGTTPHRVRDIRGFRLARLFSLP